jgi:vitamin-K-epoxide reductase (warfarin-sensitive)
MRGFIRDFKVAHYRVMSPQTQLAEIVDNIYLGNAPSLTSGWESCMRWLLIVLAVVGIVASSLALREHYRTDTSPCSINERWDCGIVNHSPYAMLYGIPVAVIGIAGYLLLGVLAFMKAYRVMLVAAMGGLGFALHLARIESVVLGVWCIYCVISLGVISLLSLLALGIVIVNSMSRSRETA